MARDIMDFTDLGEYTEFAYRNEKFGIPAFTKSQLLKLMELHAKARENSDDDDESAEIDEETGEKREKPLDVEKVKKTLDFIDGFIVCGIRRKNESGDFVEITTEEFNGMDWPEKLKRRVMKLVSDEMGSQSNEGDIEKNS